MKSFPYYGRDMEILLLKTKITHSRRVFGQSANLKTILTLTDMEKGLDLFKKHNTLDKEKHLPPSMYT